MVHAMQILLAEDDVQYRSVLREALELYGHTVLVAADGVEAYDLLAKHGNIEVIISDINMPRRTGTQLHEIVRDSSHLKHIPFVYITGFAILRAATPLEGNNLDFIVSKVPFDRLLRLVEELSLSGRILPDKNIAINS